jgi:hypothetical protein
LRGLKLKNHNRRFYTSLTIGLGFLFVLTFLFFKVRHGEKEGSTPVIIRKSFIWNEEIWKIVQSSKRQSVARPKPPLGQEPRVNGMLGLETGVYLSFYFVEINSGEKNLQLPLSAFKVIPRVEYSTDFRCIEGWSEVVHYSGTKFSDFLNHYGLGKKPDGTYFYYVGFETPDRRYYVSIDMESMLHEQTVLAYEMNGKPLSKENGAPLRLIIPIKYGIKSLKRIGRIFFSDERPADYWAERGYDWYSGL